MFDGMGRTNSRMVQDKRCTVLKHTRGGDIHVAPPLCRCIRLALIPSCHASFGRTIFTHTDIHSDTYR